MQFSRFFTRPGVDPLQTVEVETRRCEIPGSGFVMEEVVVPVGWSQNAANVVAQKYLRKAGVPSETQMVLEDGIPTDYARSEPAPGAVLGGETDVRSAVRRMAGCWTYWGFRMGLFDSEDDGDAFFDEICHTLVHQMWAPNSPQWFNTGLHWAYGIERPPQGHYFYDESQGTTVPSPSAYERPQPHACFIQSVSDDLVNPGGIMDLFIREARLFKYGSGTGTNFSAIRGLGEPLSGGGVSSGLMSWLKIGDSAAQGIKSGGTTRRAAKMVLLNDDHPEVQTFVNWKASEEQKVLALVAGSRVCSQRLNAILKAIHGAKDLEGDAFDPRRNAALGDAVLDAREAGLPDSSIWRAIEYGRQGVRELAIPTFDTDWQGDAYETVSGQQSNNSVSVTRAFLDAVDADAEWALRRRTDGEVHTVLMARELWSDITEAAWASADPGLQYRTTMNEWHTCINDGQINGSNPCSEYMFLDDTACNLASLNLVKLESGTADVIDIEAMRHLTKLVTTVLEISVAMSQLPSEAIALRTWQYRTLGLGYANLGALVMRQGLPYDSDGARGIAAAITALMSGEAYAQSARLAAELGTFDRYEANAEPMMRVINNHYRASLGSEPSAYVGLSVVPRGLVDGDAPDALIEAARSAWVDAVTLGHEHGFRNAQVSCLAPTGTIGLEMDCDTTGVEPDYALVKFKSLAGGGGMTIINGSVPVALERLGYSPRQVKDIEAYIVGTRALHPELKAVLDRAGFTGEMQHRMEQALGAVPHLVFAMSESVVGRDDIVRLTDLTSDDLDTGADLLSMLGVSTEQIERWNRYSVGTMTIEGAPHIRSEHLAVFDCASRCGLLGTRCISPDGHLRMMAAVQPFLSGAISKTVNMPRESTVADVRRVYRSAYDMGLKAVAIYRDGSKLSQPLESRLAAELFDGLKRSVAAEPPQPTVVKEVVEKLVVRYLADRRKLPWNRRGYTQKVVIDGHKVYLRTGEYSDGTLGEIFIDSHKEGAAFRSLLGAFAMAISVGLQHGVPLERFVDLYTFTKFEPHGPVQGDSRIMMCTSLMDYIFRNLAVNYLGRDELAHVPADQALDPSVAFLEPEWERERVLREVPVMLTDTPIEVNEPGLPVQDTAEMMVEHTFAATGGRVSSRPASTRSLMAGGGSSVRGSAVPVDLQALVEAQGYLGRACGECHELRLVQNGTCAKCTNCGATTGCS